MRSKFKKIILLSVTVFVIFSFYSTAQAQNSELGTYTVLAPLPGIQDGSNQTSLQRYLPNAFNLAMGVAAVMAFVMITFGGIMYVVSDSLSGKTDGRKYVEDAVLGLLLVIGAWVILNTINPAILRFNLDIKPPDQEFVQPAPTVCSNCVTLASLSLPVSGSAIGASIAPYFGEKLALLKNNLLVSRSGITWFITEAYPPSVSHISTCHNIGTCVDAKLSNPTAANINAFADMAIRSGLAPSYEVKTIQEKQALVQAGARDPLIKVNEEATGAHFHIR